MDAKHTPGPWYVGQDDTNGQAIVRGEHIEIATCWHHCVGSIEKEMRANARLIAAAPEMLDALRRAAMALAFFSETSPAARDDYNAVSAAIATATQPEPTP